MDSRRSFLHFSYSAASLFVGSAITQAFSKNTTSESRNGQTRKSPEPNMPNAKPIFVPPDGNRSAEPTGNIKIRVSGNDNGGAVAVVEVQTTLMKGLRFMSITSKTSGSTLLQASTISRSATKSST